jgi:signal transduction histidine kinase/DNA-binding NarL/FixJ family response regulator
MNSILIVDQNAESSEQTARYLQDSGISRVIAAHSPAEALAILENRTIDGIVAVFDLDKGNAITLLSEVRLYDSDVPFVLWKAPDDSKTAIQALNSGADAYIPVDTDPSDERLRLHEALTRITAPRKPVSRWSHASRLLKGIAESLEMLLSKRDLDEAVNSSLAILGTAVGADRVYIFENSYDPATDTWKTSQRYEWAQDFITPQINNPDLQDVRYESVAPRWFGILSKGGVVSGNVADFPDNEREILEPQGIVALLTVPIMVNGSFWGFIGFDDCSAPRQWNDTDRFALQTSANMVGMVIVQRRSEKAEIEKKEIIQTLLDSIPDTAVLLDGEGNFLALNHTSLSCLQKINTMPDLRYRDLIGKNFCTFMPPKLIASRNTAFIDAAVTGKPAEFEDEYGGRIYQNTIVPILNEAGTVTMLAVYNRNITKMKEAEHILNQKRDILYGMINSSSDLLAALDTDFRFIAFNTAYKNSFQRTFATNPELGMRLDDTLSHIPDTRDKLVGLWGLALEGKEYCCVEQFGTEENLEFVFNALRDSQNKLIGAVHIARDITERQQAEKALRQANNKLSLLSSITRHDIRNQLTVIFGFLEILKATAGDEEMLSFIGKIQDSARTILRQVEFSRDYQEIGVREPQWFDAEQVIQNAAGMLDTGDVQVLVQTGSAKIHADPLLEKVFYNLIENAVHYGGGGLTTIHFYTKETDTGLTLICEDNGAGIAQDVKELIFKQGYGRNTGYGLFLIREILHITGITIQETGVMGQGARFEMHIPGTSYRMAPAGA